MYKKQKKNKWNVYKKIIVCFAALLIVFIPSIIMNQWALAQNTTGPVGPQNPFLHINITFNNGAAFSLGDNNPVLMRSIQFILCTCVLLIAVVAFSQWYYSFFLFSAAFGGYFNFVDALIPKNLGAGVVDYLQSDYLVNKAIFNVPDVCVTGSAAIFACIFMIGMIYKFSTGIENKPNRKLPINLFIDTTQTKCNICLFQEDKVIISFSIKTHNNLTDLIIEHIKKMLKRVGVSSSSIAGIYVVKGPGSFTGVRIGTMIAKTYGLLENKKVFSISALRLQATSNCISILDAKGNKFYTAVFKNNKQVGRVSLKTLNDIEKLAEKYKLPIIQDFHKVNIFENIFLNINNFKLCKNTIRLRPLYIKKPI